MTTFSLEEVHDRTSIDNSGCQGKEAENNIVDSLLRLNPKTPLGNQPRVIKATYKQNLTEYFDFIYQLTSDPNPLPKVTNLNIDIKVARNIPYDKEKFGLDRDNITALLTHQGTERFKTANLMCYIVLNYNGVVTCQKEKNVDEVIRGSTADLIAKEILRKVSSWEIHFNILYNHFGANNEIGYGSQRCAGAVIVYLPNLI